LERARVLAIELARQDEAKVGGAMQCFLPQDFFSFGRNLFDRRENLP
jgi:hypothetical protein